MQGTISSGVALLDGWLSDGGMRAGTTSVLTGGSGTGKSALALHFVDAALKHDEPVAMLVQARADDVKHHASFLGIDLDTPLRDGRLLLLRYRSGVVFRAAQAGVPEQLIGDLERLIEPHDAARLVIDSFAPLVCGTPATAAAAALADFLERSEATKVLTFPEDLADGYDRALEPIVQSASAIIRLLHDHNGMRRAELVNVRDCPPRTASMRFMVREGRGVVADKIVSGGERVALRMP